MEIGLRGQGVLSIESEGDIDGIGEIIPGIDRDGAGRGKAVERDDILSIKGVAGFIPVTDGDGLIAVIAFQGEVLLGIEGFEGGEVDAIL